jgi:hypothetical protein
LPQIPISGIIRNKISIRGRSVQKITSCKRKNSHFCDRQYSCFTGYDYPHLSPSLVGEVDKAYLFRNLR